MSEIYFSLSQTEQKSYYYKKRAERLTNCGTWLQFMQCPNGHKESTYLKTANFCKLRLCSLCQWRRSLFTYHQFLTVAHEVQERCSGCQFIFMTLTGKNVTAEELPNAITHYLKSFRRLTMYKIFKQAIKGTFRTLEITYNARTNTFHPHFHIISVVNSSYFHESSKNYISQKRLTELWKKAFQVEYTPIVDIRKVRKKKENKKTVLKAVNELNNDLAGAAAEVAKYAVKFSDIFKSKNKQEVVKVLDLALAGRRMIAYTGIMKQAHIALKLKDVEDSDLTDTEGSNFDEKCNCKICRSELAIIDWLFNFGYGKYKEKGTK